MQCRAQILPDLFADKVGNFGGQDPAWKMQKASGVFREVPPGNCCPQLRLEVKAIPAPRDAGPAGRRAHLPASPPPSARRYASYREGLATEAASCRRILSTGRCATPDLRPGTNAPCDRHSPTNRGRDIP